MFASSPAPKDRGWTPQSRAKAQRADNSCRRTAGTSFIERSARWASRFCSDRFPGPSTLEELLALQAGVTWLKLCLPQCAHAEAKRSSSPCDWLPSEVVWNGNGSFVGRTHWPEPGRDNESRLRQARP